MNIDIEVTLVGGGKPLGPIRKYLWKRKFAKQIGKDYLTARFILTMNKLKLCKLSDRMFLDFHMRINMHEVLKMMEEALSNRKLK